MKFSKLIHVHNLYEHCIKTIIIIILRQIVNGNAAIWIGNLATLQSGQYNMIYI